MNSLLNKNVALLKERFPDLYTLLKNDIEHFTESQIPFEVFNAKSGEITATYKGLLLHSKYNPSREANQVISSFSNEKSVAVFFAFGLGYAPSAFAKSNKDSLLILVEQDVKWFLASFFVFDWTEIFSHQKLILLVNAPVETCTNVLSNFPQKEIQFYEVSVQSSHSQAFFTELKNKLKSKEQKEQINTNTLERFAHLWLKNSCKNLKNFALLDGVESYFAPPAKNDIPFVILAAGSSLESVLPHLKELKKRAFLVCVDTALKVVLKTGIEPDFIILVDPQYACALHLEFLKTKESILITESAVWPSVFRFPCKKIVLCSSLFPMGRYFESKIGKKGVLEAGGSVSTTAWDFARKAGAKDIFIAGMDLGFSGKQTHIRGSQFEERAHFLSNRFFTAENASVTSIFSAPTENAKDYCGNTILSDKRMDLFAWWFEESCKVAEQNGQKTHSLTKKSRAINGIDFIPIEIFLKQPIKLEQKAQFLNQAENEQNKIPLEKRNEIYQNAVKDFVEQLQFLLSLSQKGIELCNKGISDAEKIPTITEELKLLDAKILHSKAKAAASLVFPTERQLEKKSKTLPQDEKRKSLYYSRLIYSELKKACQDYLFALQKYEASLE